jgi:hypothetical protein
MRDDFFQMQKILVKQFFHLIPGLVNTAADDPVNTHALKDDIGREINLNNAVWNAKHAYRAAGLQILKRAFDCVFVSAEFADDIDAPTARFRENA